MEQKMDRELLRCQYKKQRGSFSTQMSEEELQAQDKLLELKNELVNTNDLNLYNNFFDNRKIFHNSKLFKIIQKMPKGVVQHLHNPAGADIKIFYEFIQDKRVFMDPQTNTLKVFLTDKDKVDNYERVVHLIEKIGLEKVKEKVDKGIIFDRQNFEEKNTKDIFFKFADSFDSLFLGFYEPFYSPLIDSTFSTLKNDNVQAVEIRNVFGIMQKENDLSVMSFEEELNFQEKIFIEISKKYNMNYKLYHCGLKNLGKENIEQTLNQYIESQKTHPGFINGYDIVHYEGLLYLDQVYDKLNSIKTCNKNINYCFHAGESLNPNNFNVIDSIALGTKRIGHGLQVANSTFLIDLVKKQDICVEVNPLSNYMLGYVRDLNNHPAKILIQSGVKLTISPDDYTIFGELGSAMDYLLSILYFQFDLRDIKWCLQNSIDYSVFSEEEKKDIQNKFDQEWKKFIEYLIKLNQLLF